MHASRDESGTDGMSLYLCQESFPLSLIHQESNAGDIYINDVSTCLNVKAFQYPFVSSHRYKNVAELNASASVQFNGL